MRDLRDDGAMTWTAPEVIREEFRLDLPERHALEAFITWHRQTLLWKVAGLTGGLLNVLVTGWVRRPGWPVWS